MKYFTNKELTILHSNYSAAFRLRNVLLNMFNHHDYNNVNILGCMSNSDEIHLNIFYKILKTPVEYLNSSDFIDDINPCKYRKS